MVVVVTEVVVVVVNVRGGPQAREVERSGETFGVAEAEVEEEVQAVDADALALDLLIHLKCFALSRR